mgnify:CR=1 FL=1
MYSKYGNFYTCTGEFNTDTNEFHKYTPVEKRTCCLETCTPLLDECKKMCREDEECYRICEDTLEACIDNCDMSHNNLWGIDDPLLKTLRTYSCGDNLFSRVDKVCMDKNKTNIIDDCKLVCSNENNDIDCTKYCKSRFNTLHNISSDKKPKIKRNVHDKKVSVSLIMLFIVIFVSVFVLAYLF